LSLFAAVIPERLKTELLPKCRECRG